MQRITVVFFLVHVLASFAEASVYKRYYNCGWGTNSATVRVWAFGNTGRTMSIAIKSPHQDITDILVQSTSNDPLFVNWDGVPVSNYLEWADSEYNGPTSSFRSLRDDSGWSYGKEPGSSTVIYWRFVLKFANGQRCWSAWQ